eukprot:496836-Rhodomonas_salina.1
MCVCVCAFPAVCARARMWVCVRVRWERGPGGVVHARRQGGGVGEGAVGSVQGLRLPLREPTVPRPHPRQPRPPRMHTERTSSATHARDSHAPQPHVPRQIRTERVCDPTRTHGLPVLAVVVGRRLQGLRGGRRLRPRSLGQYRTARRERVG